MRAAILEAKRRDIDSGVSAPAYRPVPHPGLGPRRRRDPGSDRAQRREISAKPARRVRKSFAPEFADILEHHRRIFNFEAARNYAYEYEEHHDQVSQVLRDTVLTPGPRTAVGGLCRGDRDGRKFRRHLDNIFADVDLLLTPSAAGEAPEGLGSTGDPSFNSIWTLAWMPCVTLPAGTGPKDCRSASSSSAPASATKRRSMPPRGSRLASRKPASRRPPPQRATRPRGAYAPMRRPAARLLIQTEPVELVLQRRRDRQIGVAPAIGRCQHLFKYLPGPSIHRPVAPGLHADLAEISGIKHERALDRHSVAAIAPRLAAKGAAFERMHILERSSSA